MILKIGLLSSFLIGTCLFGNESQTTHRVFQFENEHVRVWKTIIMPHQPLKMHRHDCSRVIVGLTGGRLTNLSFGFLCSH